LRNIERRKRKMFKGIYLVKRRSDMTHEEFMQYLQEKHAPLCKKVPGLKRYVTNEVKGGTKGVVGETEIEPEWDNISELWFESKAEMEKGFASSAGKENLADVPNFIDSDGILAFFVDEKEQL
jgi:uncharacterized protein (TIGR02118 family)